VNTESPFQNFQIIHCKAGVFFLFYDKWLCGLAVEKVLNSLAPSLFWAVFEGGNSISNFEA